MDISNLYDIFLQSNGLCTDSRKIKKGDFFIALSGENFNGNSFVQQAIDSGAAHILCSDTKYVNHYNVSVVEDSLIALQQLATFHRLQLNIPIVALTGSNGKTTTKELILSILSQEYCVNGTNGNFNNHIGVPITLLSFDENTEIGIVEMGANHLGEIRELCTIAQPNLGLITNFGKAHIEGFGGIEQIKQGKSELYDYLKTNKQNAIIHPDDPEQINRTAGIDRTMAPKFKELGSQPIKLQWGDDQFTTQLMGSYNIKNMEMAAAVGLYFKINRKQIIKGLKEFQSNNNRSQIIKRDQYSIILDAYNANPSSMEVALKNLSLYSGNTIAILGDMFELGTHSSDEHQNIIELARKLEIDELYVVGSHFYNSQTNKYNSFECFEDLGEVLTPSKIKGGSHVLIKGSRGMQLERILEIL